jgi:plastocyanin
MREMHRSCISGTIALAIILTIIVCVVGATIVLGVTAHPTVPSSTSVQTLSSPLIETSIQTETTSSVIVTTSSSSYVETTSTTSTTTSSDTRSSSLTGPQIMISDFLFYPASITVVIGKNNTVTWTNSDVATHTVSALNQSFNSGDIDTGHSWTHEFLTPGNYTYQCSYHPWMQGAVIVKSA